MSSLEVDALYALPDGQQLLFQGRSYAPSPWGASMPRSLRYISKATQVYVVDLISRNVGLVLIPRGRNVPQIGPLIDLSDDGRRAAVIMILQPPDHADLSGAQIGIYDLVHGTLRRLPVQPRSWYLNGRLSPNGHRLALTRWDIAVREEELQHGIAADRTDSLSVWVSDLAKPALIPVAAKRSLCDWTSDGARLIVYRTVYGGRRPRGDVSTVEVSAPHGEKALTSSGDVFWAQVDRSRGQVFYIRSVQAGSSSSPTLWAMREDGSHARRVTSLSGNGEFACAVSPDGHRLALVDGKLLWVVETDSGKRTQLTRQEGTYRLPTWVAGRSGVAFVEGYNDYESGERILLGDPTGKNGPQLLVGKPRVSK